ncbi:MAG: hypothetical protein ABI876_17260, partial [Bacteroidota bacterium]
MWRRTLIAQQRGRLNRHILGKLQGCLLIEHQREVLVTGEPTKPGGSVKGKSASLQIDLMRPASSGMMLMSGMGDRRIA